MCTVLLFPPTDVNIVQSSATSITVTWTPPSPLGDATGYRVSYNGGEGDSSGSEDVSGGSTTSHILTGLQNTLTYTISISSTVQNFTSDSVSVDITLSKSYSLE